MTDEREMGENAHAKTGTEDEKGAIKNSLSRIEAKKGGTVNN